ncbi:MAG: hypothetical protein ACOC3C_02530 [Candidatus Thorarchaeota archaeon]
MDSLESSDLARGRVEEVSCSLLNCKKRGIKTLIFLMNRTENDDVNMFICSLEFISVRRI